MLFFRLLPWEYGIRNLLRRPLRTALTLTALVTVTLLVLLVVGFVRGLERSLAASGNSQTILVFSLGMGENLEYSSVPLRTADLLAASVEGVAERYGQKYFVTRVVPGDQGAWTAGERTDHGTGARRDAGGTARP